MKHIFLSSVGQKDFPSVCESVFLLLERVDVEIDETVVDFKSPKKGFNFLIITTSSNPRTACIIFKEHDDLPENDRDLVNGLCDCRDVGLCERNRDLFSFEFQRRRTKG